MGTRRSLVAASLLGCLAVVAGVFTECNPATGSIYDFAATDILQTKNISLSQYRNQVVVITNVATYWGLTASHYIGYNALKSKFDGQSFEILAFPCNNFELLQPEDTGTEILNGIKYVRPGNGFVPKFPVFWKVDVNGAKEHPLYTFLKKYCPPVADEFEDGLFYSPLKNEDVRWNYEQFIIDKNGKPVMRYDSDTLPLSYADVIQKYLNM